jgi:hypothetical protein
VSLVISSAAGGTVADPVGVIVIKVTIAPEFPWSPFPVVGMSIGLAAHWWFGYRKPYQQLRNQQQLTEARAARLR